MLQNNNTHRLLEVAKEFNIGRETLIEFLTDHGFSIKISNPGTKLTDQMYNALVVEFAKDKHTKHRSQEIALPKGSLLEGIGKSREDLDINTKDKKDEHQPGVYIEIQKKKNRDKNRRTKKTNENAINKIIGKKELEENKNILKLLKNQENEIGKKAEFEKSKNLKKKKHETRKLKKEGVNLKNAQNNYSTFTKIKENPNINKIQNEIKQLNSSIVSASSKIKYHQEKILLLQQMLYDKKNQSGIKQSKQAISNLEKCKLIYLQRIEHYLQILQKLEIAPAINILKETQYHCPIEWNDLIFGDGFITVKFRGRWLDRLPIKNSRKSLNVIKSHYKFRNAPKLTLEISQNKILQIINIDVLFYYIQFLENAGTHFDKQIIKSIPIFGKYRAYTKSYYKKHLPELFQPRCFSFLCEFANDELPIIPVPETVINNSGLHQIHDSFLFPLANQNNIHWYWESVEESKATYFFKTPSANFESQLQMIYDYLTGKTVNKRETLINDKKLQQQLCLITRIMHTDFNNWKNEVTHYSKIF